jgi:hypothetical protein
MMRRMTKMDGFLNCIRQLRETSDELVLSSAVIVGFPSETREELDMSIRFCNDAGYNTVACHMFSQRPGNPSNHMPGQIADEEKVWRYDHFKSLFGGRTRVDPNQRPLVELGRDGGLSDDEIIAAINDNDAPHALPAAPSLVTLRVRR